MTPKKERPQQSAEMDAATELVRMAKEQGLALTGPNGLGMTPCSGSGLFESLSSPIVGGKARLLWQVERIIHRKTLSGCCSALMNSWEKV